MAYGLIKPDFVPQRMIFLSMTSEVASTHSRDIGVLTMRAHFFGDSARFIDTESNVVGKTVEPIWFLNTDAAEDKFKVLELSNIHIA